MAGNMIKPYAQLEKKGLRYLCSAMGELNVPESELSDKERELYESYWTAIAGGDYSAYVIRTDGGPALLLSFTLTEEWCRELARKASGTEPSAKDLAECWMPMLYAAGKRAMNLRAAALVPDGCGLYAGEGTDPLGHELIVTVPYRLKDEAGAIAGRLERRLWDGTEAFFYAECDSARFDPECFALFGKEALPAKAYRFAAREEEAFRKELEAIKKTA